MRNPLSEAKYLTEKIVQKHKPKKVTLFGSVARNEASEYADIDLLIVKESHEKRPFRIKKIFEAIRGIPRSYPLDPIVYTPKELEDRQSLGDYFIKRVLSEGKALYG